MIDRPGNEAGRPRETLPRSVRIRSRRDFERVFAVKIRASDAAITLYGAPSDCISARLGIAAGRRLGNAVVRNRAKRMVREAFRRVRHTLPPATDWVVVPHAERELTVQSLQASITSLAKRLLSRIETSRTEIAPAGTSHGAEPTDTDTD